MTSGIIESYFRNAVHTISAPGTTFSIPPQEDFTIINSTQSWAITDLADREIGCQYGDVYFAGRINQQIIRLISDNMIGNGLTFSGLTLSTIAGAFGLSGSGTAGWIPVWTGAESLGNSDVQDTGGTLRAFQHSGGGNLIVYGAGAGTGNITAQYSLTVGTVSGQTGNVTFYNALNPYSVVLQTIATMTQSQTYQFPTHYPVTNGMILTSNTIGNLSWSPNTGGVGASGGTWTQSAWLLGGNIPGTYSNLLGTLDNTTLNVIQGAYNRIVIDPTNTTIQTATAGGFKVTTPTYPDTLLYISDTNGVVQLGDYNGDKNSTSIIITDALKSIVYNAKTQSFTGDHTIIQTGTFSYNGHGASAGYVLTATNSNGDAVWTLITAGIGATGPTGSAGASITGPTGATGSTGTFSATLIPGWLSAGATASYLTASGNWTNGVYTGTALTGTYQAQMYYGLSTDGNKYLYEAVADNSWVEWPITPVAVGLTAGQIPALATASAWGLLGNRGTVDGTNFLGTIDNIPLSFRVNNVLSGFIASPTTIGTGSTLLGYGVGGHNSVGNTFIGYLAGSNSTTSNQSVAVGLGALSTATNSFADTAVGFGSLLNQIGGANGTGSNSAFGYGTLESQTTGFYNTAVGLYAGYHNISGSFNTYVGAQADTYPYSGFNLYNTTAIGYGAWATTNNQVVIGNTATVQFEFSGALMPYYSGTWSGGTLGQVLTSQGPNVSPQWSSGGGGGGGTGATGPAGATGPTGSAGAGTQSLYVIPMYVSGFTFSMSNSYNQQITLTYSGTTMSMSGWSNGDWGSLEIIQPSAGAPYTIGNFTASNGNFRRPSGTYSFSTANNQVDIWVIYYDGSFYNITYQKNFV
jgi:hypothetical protein